MHERASARVSENLLRYIFDIKGGTDYSDLWVGRCADEKEQLN
jgi:hypothetical protein